MNAPSLFHLCQRVRPERAYLGELGRPLLDVVAVIERLGESRPVDVLTEPGFALDVLTAGGSCSDAAVVGRVLDFLRTRADAGPVTAVTQAAPVTITEAVEMYDRGALALMASPSQPWGRGSDRRDVQARHFLDERTGRTRLRDLA